MCEGGRGTHMTADAVMTRPEGKQQNQHYVPKLLLRNFVSNFGAKLGKEKIWAFDKATDRIANPNIKNIAAQFGFYNTSIRGKSVSIETPLGLVEEHTAPALKSLIDGQTCANLSTEQRAWLAIFCAVQFVRVHNFRQQTKLFNFAIEGKIRATGGDPAKVKEYAPMSGDEEIKQFAIGFLINSLHEFPHHFATKHWFLMQAAEGKCFYIGDNPIVLHNSLDFGPYGNIGLAVPGIEIYYPSHRQSRSQCGTRCAYQWSRRNLRVRETRVRNL